jgi:hypothetical protein
MKEKGTDFLLECKKLTHIFPLLPVLSPGLDGEIPGDAHGIVSGL